MFNFRWLTRLALAVGMVGALVAAPSVDGSRLFKGAEAMSVQNVPGTFVSAITVLNPSTSPGPANIVVDFYDPSGVKVTTVTNPPVAPGGTAFWYVPNITGLTANQTYSAVVSADQQVYATVNLSTLAGTTPIMGETYNGVDSAAVVTSAAAPSVLRNYYGFTSNVVVQNTGTAAANVSVTVAGSGSTGAINFTTTPQNVASNASFTLDLATLSNLGDNFNGAATVNGSSNNVAVISNNYTPTTSSSVPNYLFSSTNGVPAGASSTIAYVPGLYKYYYGFFTALIVQNVDTAPANVVVTYQTGATDTFSNLAPGTSHVFFTPSNGSLPSGFIGSATVSTTNGKQILAQVNVQGTPGTTSGVGLASYSGFTNGTTSVFAPGLVKNYYTFNSSLTIQNVDTTTAPAGSITITYSNGASHTNAQPLGPGASLLLYTPNEPGIPDKFNGGATVVSTGGQKIVGLINLSGVNTADQLFSTNAFGK